MKRKSITFSRFFYAAQFLCGLLYMITGCHERTASPFSRSAEEALKTFELPPGFKIELIAAEPLISDPVDMTIDEQGRMYVVEMHGYPLDLNHTGKIIMLTDTDGDGKMDKRTVFAEGLTLPTGVMRWKKGILVTDAPNVYYMEDTSGDGKADIKKIMLTGFALTNPQYLVNRPVYGLDNWIYLAHEGIEETNIYPKKFGDTGKDIFYPDDSFGKRLPVNAEGRTVRFRPDDHALEETSSSTQFGQTFDAYGHHFLVSNANHIYQEVIAGRYLKRNPEQLVGDATESLSDHGEACEVFPITKNPEHQLLTDVGVITSACGITDYLGGAFPDGYNDGNVTFVCEPVSNLVHADRLKDKGATFMASRILEHQEFLASTDAWFRPVNLYIGPDGALYVVDYYREVIEHPEWMSESAAKSGNLYNGRNKGRIYRITATGAAAAGWTTRLNLNDSTDEQLVQKLADPDIWWRQNAQRLLVDRNDSSAVPALVVMTQNAYPLGRLHALWTLEGMHKLTPELIIHALQDPVAGVRENAVQLAELHLNDAPGLLSSLLALKADPDAKVRYQLLCTLGAVNTPAAAEVRQALLLKDIDDKWVQIAALSASSSQSVVMLKGMLAKFDPGIPAYASLVQRIGAMMGSSQDAGTIHPFLSEAAGLASGRQYGWQAPFLEGLAQGLKSRRSIPPGLQKEQNILIRACLDHPDVAVRESGRHILQVTGIPKGAEAVAIMQEAKNIAGNDTLSAAKRAEALHFLALNNPEQYASFLEVLIAPHTPLTVQLAALQTLGAIPDTTVSSFVLSHWSALTPDVREVALNTFIEEPFNVQRIRLLLAAIAEGKVQKADLGWPRTVILMRDIPDTLKEQARALLANKDEDRKSVIRQYEAALHLKGDPDKGKIVYQANCVICHQVRGKMGVAFGPDLGTVRNWAPEGIMINILDPDLSISHGYDMWNVLLNDGSSRQGIISAETPNAITLRSEGGKETTIARRDIRSLRTMGISAMPVGLEKKISKQQMADLLAFLRQSR